MISDGVKQRVGQRERLVAKRSEILIRAVQHKTVLVEAAGVAVAAAAAKAVVATAKKSLGHWHHVPRIRGKNQ